MRFWLMKSEPDDVSIDDLAARPGGTVAWYGVRNFQARNFMRNEMALGDRAFFYHSSCAVPGIAGICEVSRLAFPDASQFDPQSPYFDATSRREAPKWWNVEVRFVEKLRLVTLAELRAEPRLADMRVLRRGNRLSITPVEPHEWQVVLELAARSP